MGRKIIILCISVLIGLVGTYVTRDSSDAKEMQKEIASNILRFHVLANSDKQEDQELKLKVKDVVITYMSDYINQPDLSLEETKQIVEQHKDEVVALAEEVLREQGVDYEVSAELTKAYFPVKSYGDVTLPAGEYDAFRIQIGEAQGKNWWCVLYPPLCFVDVSYGYVPEGSKKQLENVLDEECFYAVMHGGETKNKIDFRSRILDFISEKWF